MKAFLGSLVLLAVISTVAAVGLKYMSMSVQDTYTTQNVRL